MKNKYEPISISEAYWWADKAKTMPRKDVETMQRLLFARIVDVGVSSPEVTDIINGMTDRFADEERQIMKQCINERLMKQGVLGMQIIYAEDDQIVEAIKMTLPVFKSDWDWGGIYRILVDTCQFPSTKTDFVKRMAEIGIYAEDNTVKFSRPIPPSIKKDEYCNHPFSYQNVQKGISTYWPATYQEWLRTPNPDQDLCNRISIATAFYNNLIKVTDMK